GRAVTGSDLARRPFEGPDEFPADDLALDLGIRDADQRCREVRPSVENHEIDSRGGYEVPLHLLGLVLAQQAVVNEYARELRTDGALHERGRDRGIDAARQAADRTAGADLRSDPRGLLVDDVASGPVGA